jgi:MerR family transcriptional regulator/heat shock protein HspR
VSEAPNEPILPRDQVAHRLALPAAVLRRYEARGLIRVVRRGDIEGYSPAEIRRLWTVLTLQRDLGVNLAGVEAILRLKAHVEELHGRIRTLADELRAALESDRDPTQGEP